LFMMIVGYTNVVTGATSSVTRPCILDNCVALLDTFGFGASPSYTS
jgi:hypothetical protein